MLKASASTSISLRLKSSHATSLLKLLLELLGPEEVAASLGGDLASPAGTELSSLSFFERSLEKISLLPLGDSTGACRRVFGFFGVFGLFGAT